MSSKLETKLLQYEKSTPISNDDELIKAIECIIDNEESLPFEERDFDLLDEAIDAVLSLKKVDIEQLEDCAEEITDRYFDKIQVKDADVAKEYKPKSVKLKWLIPIAAIVSLLTVGTMVAYAFGIDLIGMTKEAYIQLVEKVLYKQGNNELIVTEDRQSYDSIQQLLDSKDYSELLLSNDISKNYDIQSIYVENYGTYEDISLLFESNGDTHEIYIQTPGNASFSNQDAKKICGIDVYCYDIDNKYQGQFVYKNSLYTIITSSYECLEKIIENMGAK